MSEFLPIYKKLLRDPVTFARHASKLTLRNYQRGVIESVFESVINRRGMAFVVLFPRQSSKNELQAQLEVYLLALFSQKPVEMIKVSPTLQPQAVNAMRRVEKVLRRNFLLEQCWKKEAGNSYLMGQARLTFLSGAQESSIVGATANALLEVDEAALVNGAAGCACALRAGSLVEAYGSRPAEMAQLLETSRYWMDLFTRGLDGVKVLQEFGFPPGFALDGWDCGR